MLVFFTIDRVRLPLFTSSVWCCWGLFGGDGRGMLPLAALIRTALALLGAVVELLGGGTSAILLSRRTVLIELLMAAAQKVRCPWTCHEDGFRTFAGGVVRQRQSIKWSTGLQWKSAATIPGLCSAAMVNFMAFWWSYLANNILNWSQGADLSFGLL